MYTACCGPCASICLCIISKHLKRSIQAHYKVSMSRRPTLHRQHGPPSYLLSCAAMYLARRDVSDGFFGGNSASLIGGGIAMGFVGRSRVMSQRDPLPKVLYSSVRRRLAVYEGLRRILSSSCLVSSSSQRQWESSSSFEAGRARLS